MPNVEVTCRNCGTTAVRDITPVPPTPFVSRCPDCPDSFDQNKELSRTFRIDITLSGTEDGEEVELTRLGASFEHRTLAGALADGTLSSALSPLWERLSKHADLIDATDA